MLSECGVAISTLVFLLDVFYEFLTLWSATLVEAGIDGELIRIDELRHRHTEQQCLAIAFRDAEAAQQFGGYLTSLVIGVQQITGGYGVDAVVAGQFTFPICSLCRSG